MGYFQDRCREAEALEILENAVLESETDDHVTLRVDRALWDEFTGPSEEEIRAKAERNAQLQEVSDHMKQWMAEQGGLSLYDAFKSMAFLREMNRKLEDVGLDPEDEGDD